jgi:hypothetical protein
MTDGTPCHRDPLVDPYVQCGLTSGRLRQARIHMLHVLRQHAALHHQRRHRFRCHNNGWVLAVADLQQYFDLLAGKSAS